MLLAGKSGRGKMLTAEMVRDKVLGLFQAFNAVRKASDVG